MTIMSMRTPRPRGIFGGRDFPMGEIPQPSMGAEESAVQVQPKQKLFDRNFFGNVLGNVGDLVLQNSGYAPQFAPEMDARRASMMAQAQREQAMQDYERKQRIEAQYKTSNPTEFERLLDAAGFDPAKRTKVLQDYVTNRANPMIPMQGMDESGNRTVTFVPRNGAPSTPDVPQQAVEALLRGEGTDAQFDEAFGAGAAARARGAGSGQPNFR